MGERVALTEEQIAEWERGAEGAERVTGGCLWWPSAVTALIAELRASRDREQELQQRIDTVVETARGAHRAWLNADAGTWDGPVLLASWVLAALTGTETQ